MQSASMPLAKRIPAVVLCEGYRGKILLVSIAAGAQRLVALRSGGFWHRDILRNTEAEVEALGLPDVQVRELGGAYLRFEADGSIFLWGRSDEFGACDLHAVAALLKATWPGRKITSLFEEMP
jgi:hypothetical protein